MSAIFSQLLALISQRKSKPEIPYEDASKLFQVINYFTFKEIITRETALRLLKENGSLSWTTEMFSWLVVLLPNPNVSQEEVNGDRPLSPTTTKHILYFYPGLLSLFRAHYKLNPEFAERHFNEDFKRDFPAVFEDYTPTLAEKTLFSAHVDKRYETVCQTENLEEVSAYFTSNLLTRGSVPSYNSSDLDSIYDRFVAIKNCGISEESFQKYMETNWKCSFLYTVMREFLIKDLSSGDVHTAGEILIFCSELAPLGRLILKHGNSARVATSNRLMSYLLNVPLNSFLDDKDLYPKLDSALSDLSAYKNKIVEHNKRQAARFIEDCGIEVKNCVPDRMYSYPTCELVFRVQDGELECYSRLEFDQADIETKSNTHLQLSLIDAISPVHDDIYKEQGLDIIKLFQYYSKTDYYIEAVTDAEESYKAMSSCSHGSAGCPGDALVSLLEGLEITIDSTPSDSTPSDSTE